MGCYDSVIDECACGAKLEWQSKAYKCDLLKYSPHAVEPAVAIDLNGEILECEDCSRRYKLTAPQMPKSIHMIVTAYQEPEEGDETYWGEDGEWPLGR